MDILFVLENSSWGLAMGRSGNEVVTGEKWWKRFHFLNYNWHRMNYRIKMDNDSDDHQYRYKQPLN